ncbi:MAG TPA: glucuronate isomerase, partial [Segeticoccus sp.]|nr:glucuronate isomerase [Segeticoccus sp.]
MPAAPLLLHPDRLLPVEPGTRAIARRLHEAVADLPIISPHGHVPAQLLLDDEPFADPASLFVQPDHYVTRLLHASGVPLDRLGVARGPLPETEARAVWRELCRHWSVFRGTP